MNEITFESKLLIDDFVEELKEKFYVNRITYLRYILYSSIKQQSGANREYLIEKIYADKFLLDNFSDIILQVEYEQSKDFDKSLYQKGTSSRNPNEDKLKNQMDEIFYDKLSYEIYKNFGKYIR